MTLAAERREIAVSSQTSTVRFGMESEREYENSIDESHRNTKGDSGSSSSKTIQLQNYLKSEQRSDEVLGPSWKGEPLESLRTPCEPLSPLKWSPVHKIFFRCDGSQPIILQPYPNSYLDTWSDSHVRMPCSPESLYPVTEGGKKSLLSRWSFIESKLREKIFTSQDFQNAILSYNMRFSNTWNFNVLHSLVSEELIPDGGSTNFFQMTLPAVCALALNLPIYLTRAIPLMKTGHELSLTFSQLQIASIVANAFLCTFPRRNSRRWDAEFGSYPFINCAYLFTEVPRRGTTRIAPSLIARKREKLRCLLHYFYRVLEKTPTGAVTFTRRCLGNHAPEWAASTRSFDQLRFHVNASGTIEDSGPCTIHVDFANRYLGGGVLNRGTVQEEIMFLLQPELIASCLFVERLADDETVIIEGTEQYSAHEGYGSTFRWAGDFQQTSTTMERDEWGRWKRTIVAMDATSFSARDDQFDPTRILRELNKAYCGFCDELAPHRKLPSVVATGNWGCGAFRGNVYLKALLQMMACCQAGKSMAYYTFGDAELRDKLYDMYQFLSSSKITVGQVWITLVRYNEDKGSPVTPLYDFLKQRLQATS